VERLIWVAAFPRTGSVRARMLRTVRRRKLRNMNTIWHGYRVDAPDGRLGIVDEITDAADGSPLPLLAIRIGRDDGYVLHLPLDDIEFVDSRRHVVMLGRREPAPVA
jgi:hypothetical protein